VVRIGLVFLILLAAAGAACDEALDDLGPTPNLEPTLSSIQREIFNNSDSRGRAACIQCHTNANGRVPDGGLSLLEGQSLGNLVGVQSTDRAGVRVIATNPDGSYLIQKLEGASGIVGVRMPSGGPYLTQAQVDVIREWIRQGARNN
jgi:mono/diheme cytochrome c family protein